MADDWIMVRVLRRTHERLEAVRQSMLIGNDMGVRELQFDNRDRVSLDQVISELIYFRAKHAARRRASAARRRAARRQARELQQQLDQAGDVAGDRSSDLTEHESDTASSGNPLFARKDPS